MTAENAYQEVLGVLPERILVNILDSLSSGEYVRVEVERLVKLSMRAKEKSFTFSDKQLDGQMKVLVSKIDTLNTFLETHYSPLDSAGSIFQLYPKTKHEDEITTQDGDVKSWSQLRDKGLELGRAVRVGYEKLVELYQRKTKSSQKGRLFPYKIPSGTRWEDFIFAFIDDETVVVKVKQHEAALTFEDMGLADGRAGTPVIQWELLKVFAKNNGEIAATSPDARNRYKKQKQILSQTLQEYFSIDFDPFRPYEGAYKAKFTIFYKDHL